MTELVAHRANTPQRLEELVAGGAGWVELDAAAGPEGELACAHEPGEAGAPLAAMLAAAARAGLRVTVDLKCPPGLVARACEAIVAAGLEGRALVCGHYERPWDEIRRMLPAALLGWSTPEPGRRERLLRRGPEQRELAASAPGLLESKGLDVLLAHRSLVSEPLVRALHADGKLVHAWTVNRAGRARRLARMGVDAMVTDRPREIAAGLARSS